MFHNMEYNNTASEVIPISIATEILEVMRLDLGYSKLAITIKSML